MDDPESFAERVLAILCEEFPIKAASLYSYQPQSKVLVLRGQSGLDYKAYKSFELSIDTPAGQPIKTGEVFSSSDISLNSEYRDRELIVHYNLKSMVAVLLRSKPLLGKETQSPLGVICAYPVNVESMIGISTQLQEVAPFIARLYSATLDQKKMRLRKKLVEKAGYSHDMSGLLHRTTRAFKESIQVEVASIFLHDHRNGFLRLRATTGAKSLDLRNVFYVKESKDSTNLSFQKNQMLILENNDSSFDWKRIFEISPDKARNGIIFPIEEAAVHPKDSSEKKPVLGVLRAFNHTLTHQGVSHLTTFGWEEVALIGFFVEMVAVLVHFMNKGDNAQNDFARSMHGANNNLQAAQFNLELLEEHPDSLSPSEKEYFLSDAISFLSDIRSQISRLELRHHDVLDKEEIAIFGDVLSKIPPIIRRSAHAYNAGTFEVTQLKEAGFDKLPMVAGNRDALMCVFRNLVENAVKYCKPDSNRHKIEISYKITADDLKIRFADDGVGIPVECRPLIFVEGYRTEDAIARHPSSNGFGLSDSRDLMERMNGSITLVPDPKLTIFEVTIPLWK